jgi:pimeloyl-ACP methyl ester carboxylesterase
MAMLIKSLLWAALFSAVTFAALTVGLGLLAPTAPTVVPAESARLVALDSGVIRVDQTGEGTPVVLFLHGFNSELDMWRDVWQRSSARGRRVRIDIPGFGASDWQRRSYDISSQAQRIITLLDSLDVGRVVIIGASMGGTIAAKIAARYPERVDGLVLLAPSGYTGSLRWPGPFGWLLRPGLPNAVATRIADTAPYRWLFPRSRALQALGVTASYGPAWVAELGRIQAPSLLLWSRGDEGAHSSTATAVQRAIPGARLLWLDAPTGHMIQQTRADLVAAVFDLIVQGVPLSDLARAIPADVLRPSEHIVSTDPAIDQGPPRRSVVRFEGGQ